MGAIEFGGPLQAGLVLDGISAQVLLLQVRLALYSLAVAGFSGEVGLALDVVQARHQRLLIHLCQAAVLLSQVGSSRIPGVDSFRPLG